MWSQWLTLMKVPHLVNDETFTFADELGSDIRFKPAIIIPEVELSFVSDKIYTDAQNGILDYRTTVPLFLHFDPVSSAYVEVAPKLLSPAGYAEISPALLPCRNEVDDFDLKQYTSIGSFYLPQHQSISKFGNMFDKKSTYFTSINQHQTNVQSQFVNTLFGRTFFGTIRSTYWWYKV